MKPMGTITKYFQFIDDESRVILESLMDESRNYYDFVKRLDEVVLNNKVPINLAYLAAVHTWWCRLTDLANQIQEKYEDVPCIRPWGYLHVVMTQLEKERERVVEAINRAKDTQLDDWMEVEFHIIHSYFHYPVHGDISSMLKPLEKAEALIEINPLLACFEPLIYALKGWAMLLEGDAENSLEILEKGKRIAESYNDSLFWYVIVINEGAVLLNHDVQLAMIRFQELYELVLDFDVPYLLSEVLNDSAIVFETAGEYDLAISSHIEVRDIIGENYWTSMILSRIYSTLGDGQKAFDEINQFIDQHGPPDHHSWGLRRARAFALLGRVNEAEQDLDDVHAQIMKTGWDTLEGNYYHISGVIEMARGEFHAALDTLEKSWAIAERMPRFLSRSIVLLDLARTELHLLKESSDTTGSATPGKWLTRLEKHATDHDLPGIKMQAALLKSEFYQHHDQFKDAQGILQEALEITDSLGVGTLRNRIIERIDELTHLIEKSNTGK
ncbi:MAG: tetratricopeptide repeat protein [Candidatus Thorarchaeota archaeon]